MSRRSRKVYFLTFGILFRYLKLYYLSKIFGKSYWENRVSSLHKKSAHKIKKVLLDVKGLYIKVGQLISILSNVLPEEFREPLESLQDQLPARDYCEIKQTIEHEFGKPINNIFKYFDKTALASASIGQTHRATLKNGTEVVVKIQHNDIEDIAATDLNVIKNLVKLYARFFSIKGMNHMYTQIKSMIEDELDYEHEAKAMMTIGENLNAEKGISVPKVFQNYSNKKVITSAFSEGVKITNIKQLDDWQVDRKDLAKRFVQMYSKMIFEDDIFHADPHPGNILVKQNGDIVLLDFGAVTHISQEMKAGIPEFIMAFTKNDTNGMIKTMRKMGFIGSGNDAKKLAEKFINIGQDFLQNEIEITSLNLDGINIDPDSKIISKLLNAINLREISNAIQIPKDWVLLQRVLILVLGISNQLDPKMDLKAVVQPYFKKLIYAQKGGVRTFVIDAIKNQVTTLLSIPNELKNTLQKINKGEIEFTSKTMEKQSKRLTNTLQQIVFVLLTIAAVHFASYFYNLEYFNAFTYAKWFGIVFFAIFLRYFLWKKS
jgi:predicted unusual protein kinase regulating ubiquinone biosynthesis (AarF/ABC1/UbiB family)